MGYINKITRRIQVLFDRMRGLDFLSTIKPEDVGLSSILSYRSSPSGDRYLKNLLNDFEIKTSDCIIDIGCGKGSAMRTMLSFPFSVIDGLELSESISAIASLNFEKLEANRCKIITGNASEFTDLELYNFIYFYNPFPCDIMCNVIDNLTKSISNREREVVIIYNNPKCNDVVCQGIFNNLGAYPDKWGNGINVYSNYKLCDSRISVNKDIHLMDA